MDRVTLVTEGWASDGVFVASSFLERWRGVKSLPDGSRLLLAGRSVHGFGLKRPLRVAAIGGDMRVSHVQILRPGRVLSYPRARFILEMPLEGRPPPTGSILELRRG